MEREWSRVEEEESKDDDISVLRAFTKGRQHRLPRLSV